jgi:transcriptional regulator with XRE-family HTH domain
MDKSQARLRRRAPAKLTLDATAIGRRVREIRGFDLTQAEFGKAIGIGQKQLSKYELGQSVPTPEVLLKLKEYSGRSVDWILTGEESGGSG